VKPQVRSAFAAAVFILPLLLATSVSADKCGIPMDTNVTFEESAQNAVAAWNGEKECLILSTDLRSSAPGRLMEMIPLPSAPYDIQAGNTSSFKKMIGLYNDKMRRLDVRDDSGNEKAAGTGDPGVEEFKGIEILFSTAVGLHNITVVKIESADHFIQWARQFAGEQGVPNISIEEQINHSVADYLSRSIQYFVFDIVTVTGEKRTAEPVVYMFNTSYLYYPLKTTYDSLNQEYYARNEISVFLVADGVVNARTDHEPYVPGVHFSGGTSDYIEFTPSELKRVWGPMGALFGRNAFVVHYSGMMYRSDHHGDDIRDIALGAEDFRRPTDGELRAQYERADFLRAIKPLSPSLSYYILRSTYDPGYAPPAFFLALIMLGILLGPVVLGLMFKSVMDMGKKKNLLWRVWLFLYIDGMIAIMSIALISKDASFDSVSSVWLPVVFLAVFIPFVAVLYLGERFKRRPATKKHSVSAMAFGMAAVQALVFVFVPYEIVAIPIDILCFPSLGIIGLIVIPAVILLRLRKRPQQA
jgi:hypothetical protein